MSAAKIIYVVDDDEAVRDSTRALLEASGYLIQAFSGPAAMLDWTGGDGADCLLLDIHMPGLSGVDLLEVLRSRGVQTPAILMTGRPDPLLESRIFRAGVISTLQKPLSSRILLDCINRALGIHKECPGAVADKSPARY